MSLRVAVADGAGEDGATPARAEGLAKGLAASAAAAGARLLVLPAGFFTTPEPCDGALAQRMRGLARAHRLGIAYGYLEEDAGERHDSLLFIDEEGCCRTSYRRVHLRPAEAGEIAPGQWLSVMPHAGRRLGFLIGFDVLFPEQARALRLAGADLLLALGRAGGGRIGEAGPLLHAARAAENGCELVLSGPPAAGLYDAEGRHHAGTGPSTGQGGLRLLDLGPRPPVVARDEGLLARRPRLYQRLLAEVEREA